MFCLQDCDFDPLKYNSVIECEKPNNDLNRFRGYMWVFSQFGVYVVVAVHMAVTFRMNVFTQNAQLSYLTHIKSFTFYF